MRREGGAPISIAVGALYRAPHAAALGTPRHVWRGDGAGLEAKTKVAKRAAIACIDFGGIAIDTFLVD